jgi:hypothetical protein
MRVSILVGRGVGVALVAASLGCATGETGAVAGAAKPGTAGAARASAELTPEGLRKVEGGPFEHEYLKPGTSLASYKQILLDPVGLAYTKGDAPQRKIDPEDLEKMRSAFQKEVAAELTGAGYALATAPGPDVLRIQAEAVDLKLHPPRGGLELDPDATDYALSSESAIVVATLRDSESGEILARVAQTERSSGRDMEVSDQLSTWNDIRELFRRWATLLREMLDQARRR